MLSNNIPQQAALWHAGADVDVQDPEGYTPLHMAAGYLHVEAVEELLKGGADITRSDKAGRDVRTLVDSLRERMTSANSIQQRMRLEKVCGPFSLLCA
jgi:signal recognition particle 43 kDa protein